MNTGELDLSQPPAETLTRVLSADELDFYRPLLVNAMQLFYRFMHEHDIEPKWVRVSASYECRDYRCIPHGTRILGSLLVVLDWSSVDQMEVGISVAASCASQKPCDSGQTPDPTPANNNKPSNDVCSD